MTIYIINIIIIIIAFDITIFWIDNIYIFVIFLQQGLGFFEHFIFLNLSM